MVLKVQAGVRVDGEVWNAFKSVCRGERVRAGGVVEGFLRVVLEAGSALDVLQMLQGAMKARAESVDDYVKVLLSWHNGGRRWVSSEGRDFSVEAMLLFVLREVSNSQLRRKIRKTLTAKHDDPAGKMDDLEESADEDEEAAEEQEPNEPAPSSAAEKIRGMKKQAAGLKLNFEERQKILKKIREIRKGLKGS